MKRISLALLSIAALVVGVPAHTQDKFPSKPIKPVPNASIADAKAWADKELAHWKHVAATVKVEKPE